MQSQSSCCAVACQDVTKCVITQPAFTTMRGAGPARRPNQNNMVFYTDDSPGMKIPPVRASRISVQRTCHDRLPAHMGRHSQWAVIAACSSGLRAAKSCEADLQQQPCAVIVHTWCLWPSKSACRCSWLLQVMVLVFSAIFIVIVTMLHVMGKVRNRAVAVSHMRAHGHICACISTLTASVRTPVHKRLATLHLTCAYAISCCAQLFPGCRMIVWRVQIYSNAS